MNKTGFRLRWSAFDERVLSGGAASADVVSSDDGRPRDAEAPVD